MFITFEGIDGSGKTTCIEKLKHFIESNFDKEQFIFTREPGGTNLKECEEIRNLVLNKNNHIDSTSEMLLYLASRKMHVEKLIKPALKKGKIVLSDRFFDSSFAYQGGGRELGIDFVEKLNLKILDNFMPDYTFYFAIDFETAQKRMIKNNKNLDRLDQENKLFFENTIQAYDYLANKYSKRYIVIDATKDLDSVFNQILEEFKKITNFLC